MLSQLLSSKHKSGVVHIFLTHPNRSFTLSEVKASTKCPPKLLNETIKDLSKMGFLLVHERNRVKFFQVDKHFALYPELISLLGKVNKLPQDVLAKELAKLRDCKLILLTGIFVGRPRIETDILFVGKVSEKRLASVLKIAHKFAEQEVNYTLMPLSEFEYRKIMSDRFTKNILENHPVIVLDKTKNKSVTKLVQRI
jgi:hypothetical protein